MLPGCPFRRPYAHSARLPAPSPCALQAVLVPSEQLPEDAPTIRGHDFNDGCDLDSLLGSMLRTGLQATALGQAINEVNRMVGCVEFRTHAAGRGCICLQASRAAAAAWELALRQPRLAARHGRLWLWLWLALCCARWLQRRRQPQATALPNPAGGCPADPVAAGR